MRRHILSLCIVVLSLVLFLVIRLGMICITSGESMLPTLEDNDLLLVDINSDYDYNDIVIVKKEYNLVKRIVAKENDSICINEDFNVINSDNGDYVISDNCYFVLGDNRANSRDSRDFGEIKESELSGRVVKNLTKEYGLKLWHIRLFQVILIILLILLDWRKEDNAGKIKWNSGNRTKSISNL